VIFDAHTHIQFPAYDKDREEVIKRAREAGVKMITVGTNFETSKEGVDVAEKHPDDIWATVGFHPSHAGEDWYHDKKEVRKGEQEEFDIDKFRELAAHPQVVAIGECGLDYYRGDQNKKAQEEVLKQQIKLAEETNKPLMIHCRPGKDSDDAYEDLLKIIEIEDVKPKTTIHFFVGSLAVAKKLLAAGCYFTFGGVITFVRDYDEIIKHIPLEKIMLETDAPYVSPEPHRGKRNEPAYVIEVGKKLAEIKGISYEKAAAQTTANVKEVFTLSDLNNS